MAPDANAKADRMTTRILRNSLLGMAASLRTGQQELSTILTYPVSCGDSYALSIGTLQRIINHKSGERRSWPPRPACVCSGLRRRSYSRPEAQECFTKMRPRTADCVPFDTTRRLASSHFACFKADCNRTLL